MSQNNSQNQLIITINLIDVGLNVNNISDALRPHLIKEAFDEHMVLGPKFFTRPLYDYKGKIIGSLEFKPKEEDKGHPY